MFTINLFTINIFTRIYFLTVFKTKETDLRKERDDLLVEQVRIKTQLKQEVESKTEELNLLQVKATRLEKTRDELEAEIEKISKEKVMLEQMITELTEDASNLERKVAAERDEAAAIKTQLEEAVKQKNSQIEDLTSQLLQTQIQITESGKDTSLVIKTKEEMIATMRKETDRLQMDIDQQKRNYEARIEKLKDDHEEDAKAMKESHSGKLISLNMMFEKTSSELMSKVQEKETKMAEIVTGTALAAEAQKNQLMTERSQDKTQFDSYVESLSSKLSEMQKVIAEKQTNIETIVNEKKRLEDGLEQAIAASKQTNDQLQLVHTNAQQEIAKAQTEIDKQDLAIKNLSVSLETERSDHDNTRREHAQTKIAHDKMQSEIESMHEQWKTHEDQLKQSTTLMHGQLQSLHADAGSKGQKIGGRCAMPYSWGGSPGTNPHAGFCVFLEVGGGRW